MWRLFFLGLMIWLAVYFFKRHINKDRNPDRNQRSDLENAANNDNNKHSKDTKNIEDMVQCTTCKVHLPRSEAFLVTDNFYCCQAHIQQK